MNETRQLQVAAARKAAVSAFWQEHRRGVHLPQSRTRSSLPESRRGAILYCASWPRGHPPERGSPRRGASMPPSDPVEPGAATGRLLSPPPRRRRRPAHRCHRRLRHRRPAAAHTAAHAATHAAAHASAHAAAAHLLRADCCRRLCRHRRPARRRHRRLRHRHRRLCRHDCRNGLVVCHNRGFPARHPGGVALPWWCRSPSGRSCTASLIPARRRRRPPPIRAEQRERIERMLCGVIKGT